MRSATRSLARFARLALVAAVALAGCDDQPRPASGAISASSATATAANTAVAVPTATATASATVAAQPMPPRPVPLGSSGPIQPSAPAEQQMMAITYTMAMVTPRGNDALTVDKTYLDNILQKLEIAVRSADKGKTPPNPVKGARGNRKIEIEMGRGCTDKVPANLLAQRAGSSLEAAHAAGVLVISCHDDKWECHQSTRDPADVLCHAAPRH